MWTTYQVSNPTAFGWDLKNGPNKPKHICYIFPIDSSNAECTRKHSYISHIPYRFFTSYIFQNQKSSTQPLSIFSLMENPLLPAWACKTCACICRRSCGSHWWPLKSFWNINGPIESDRNEQGQTSPPKKGLQWIQHVDAQWIYWITVMYLQNFECCYSLLEDPKQRWTLDYDWKINPHHHCL